MREWFPNRDMLGRHMRVAIRGDVMILNIRANQRAFSEIGYEDGR